MNITSHPRHLIITTTTPTAITTTPIPAHLLLHGPVLIQDRRVGIIRMGPRPLIRTGAREPLMLLRDRQGRKGIMNNHLTKGGDLLIPTAPFKVTAPVVHHCRLTRGTRTLTRLTSTHHLSTSGTTASSIITSSNILMVIKTTTVLLDTDCRL